MYILCGERYLVVSFLTFNEESGLNQNISNTKCLGSADRRRSKRNKGEGKRK
jgi:hypothetical protein